MAPAGPIRTAPESAAGKYIPMEVMNLNATWADIRLTGGISGAPVTKPAPPSDHTPLGRRCAFKRGRQQDRSRVNSALCIFPIQHCRHAMLCFSENQQCQRRQRPDQGCEPQPDLPRSRALPRHLCGKRYRGDRSDHDKPRHQAISGCCLPLARPTLTTMRNETPAPASGSGDARLGRAAAFTSDVPQYFVAPKSLINMG